MRIAHRPAPTRETLDDLRRKNFAAFFHCFFPIICGEALRPDPYVAALCYAFEQFARGKRLRQIVSLPPRHTKSVAAVMMTAWILGRDPKEKVICVSYGGELADAQTALFRKIVTHSYFQRLFPRFKIKTNRIDLLETTLGGSRRSTTPSGAATGFGAGKIIIDDILKAGDSYSDAVREDANSFFDETLYSRFNNKQTGGILAIGQRLHEHDIIGHLRRKCEWHELVLPSIAQTHERYPAYNGTFFTREPGDTLSSLETIPVLNQIRGMIGKAAFSAQYMQEPIPPGGARVRWGWFPEYDYPFDLEDVSHVVQSWDTATSSDPNSAYSVCLTFGRYGEHWLVLDVYRKQVEFPDLRRDAVRLCREWGATKVLVEDASSGRQLIQEMGGILGARRSMLYPMKPFGSKEERLDLASGRLEEGMVAVPDTAPWLEAFKREVTGFPYAAKRDQVDALSQFVRWAGSSRARGFLNAGSPTRRARTSPRPRSTWASRTRA